MSGPRSLLRQPLSRRAVLRGALGGAAVGLALPPLEAMFSARAHGDTSDLGPIFGVFFWANGLPWHAGHGSLQAAVSSGDRWTPATTGAGYAPSELLSPLSRHQVNVITGLEPKTEIPTVPDGQSDGHMRGFMVALTGDRPRPEGFDHPSHTLTALRPSIDQVVARDSRFYARFPSAYRSLELGVSTARFHEYGHWNNISYNGPDAINPATLDPGRLYDLLFGREVGDPTLGKRGLLLDAVLADAAELRGRLGASDQVRLDNHMEHLFEVQRRLSLSDLRCDPGGGAPGSSDDLLAQTRTMSELLAIGLSCNVTRVFSFMLSSPASTHVFTNLGVRSDMHSVCHAGDYEAVRSITAYQMEAFALLLDALAAEVDPTGANLLDRALVYGTSEYGEGYQHDVKEFPMVLAGGANGGLVRGVHVRAPGAGISEAQVTALRAIGLETPSFGWNGGEATAGFPELLA
jgi:hypothetical protein